MKVISAETFVVRLDTRSTSLSGALEQTVTVSSGDSKASLWVVVYLLIAEIEQNQLLQLNDTPQLNLTTNDSNSNINEPQICVEQRTDSSLVLYNSAYERVVALPAPPNNKPFIARDELYLLDDCLLLMMHKQQQQNEAGSTSLQSVSSSFEAKQKLEPKPDDTSVKPQFVPI